MRRAVNPLPHGLGDANPSLATIFLSRGTLAVECSGSYPDSPVAATGPATNLTKEINRPKLKQDNELKSRYRGVRVAGKRMDEHRYVASCILGRPLQPGEVVHHKDGNKLNNDPSNLEIMSATEHKRLHALNSNFSKMPKDLRSVYGKMAWTSGRCNHLKYAVVAFDRQTGKEVARYESTRDAIRDGHASSHVSDCCSGKRRSYHKLIWRYAKDLEDIGL